ncbi:MAG: SLC13 family permease [Bacteroidales bacterium]|nr:SLC13 family permease [Bacteroidales bacterium]
MISFDQIIVIIVILFILIALYKELIGPAFTFVIGVLTLGIFKILTPSEILKGFANEQIAVIILLLLIGDIIRRTSLIDTVFEKAFSRKISQKHFTFRMTSIVAGMSAFLNNTPLVAIMMPYVNSWSKSNNVAPSKLLIPLSYAAILGGSATLIGTSTNLIVNGLVIDQTIFPELGSLHIFDFSAVGIPMIVVGVIYLVFFSEKLLPSVVDNIERFNVEAQNYIVEAQIRKSSHLIGQTIEEAKLRNLEGLFLVEIIRGNQRFVAMPPETILLENDILFFAGKTEMIADLININGLTFPEVGLLKRKRNTDIVEIVITYNSSLISKTVKEANFRGKYDAAIIGIQRNGERITQKIGSIKLKAGDLLLVLAGSDLTKRDDILDFYFISKVKEFRAIKPYKALILIGGTLLSILLSALGVVSLFMALMFLLVIILSLNIASPKDVHKSIDYNLILIIAMSLALGLAMVKTGVAQMISHHFIGWFKPLGPVGILSGIYAITALLAAYITNKVAVAIIFPISLALAHDIDANPIPFILVVAFASAANFMTPIGYQTNLMIYGPGGYKFKDFFKVGLPLTIIYGVVSILILKWMYF